jgi:hypothetical protein
MPFTGRARRRFGGVRFRNTRACALRNRLRNLAIQQNAARIQAAGNNGFVKWLKQTTTSFGVACAKWKHHNSQSNSDRRNEMADMMSMMTPAAAAPAPKKAAKKKATKKKAAPKKKATKKKAAKK